MTATTARLLPVQPGKVRNAIFNALSRHGVELVTAQSIWDDLTTGNDPRPANLPAEFGFRGLLVVWPCGRHTRALTAHEVRELNSALVAATERGHAELLDQEDTAEVGRGAFEFLWTRRHAPDYNGELVAVAKLRELVEEATARQQAEKEPVCIDIPEDDPTLAIECALDDERENVLCNHKKPGGRLHCTQDAHHDGFHAGGKSTWTNDEVVVIKVVTTPERKADAQVVALESEGADKLLADIKRLAELMGVEL